MKQIRPTQSAGEDVLRFWFDETKPYQWYRRDRSFDALCVDRFQALHQAAMSGALNVWRSHPRYCLSLILLLDQLSRNIYRDSPRAFAGDGAALNAARGSIQRRFDLRFTPKERAFFYMPFMHAEDLIAQNQCIALFKTRMPDADNLSFAITHRDIIARFGRFPHRNRILGRRSTADELAYLKAGGFNP